MTQNERIIDYLSTHGSITQLEATTELGILRLSERIRELTKAGYVFEKKMVGVNNRFGEACRVMRYSKTAVNKPHETEATTGLR